MNTAKRARRLTLSHETLRRLGSAEMREAVGGGVGTININCPTFFTACVFQSCGGKFTCLG